MKVKDWIARWQEVYDKPRSRPTTYAAHNYIFKNHILPKLGEIELTELTTEMVGNFLDERKHFGSNRPESQDYPGLSNETMRHIHRLLQHCLEQAVNDGLIAENPAKAFGYKKKMATSAKALTALEMELYLDAAESLGYLPMFLLELTVGLRPGELIALKWSDLDVSTGVLTIAEQRAVENCELKEYGSQTREVRLSAEVVEQLIKGHEKHPNSPLMFMHPGTRKPYSLNMVRLLHKKITEVAGLEHVRFVDLRHTCASVALQSGEDVEAVSKMLGHYRVSMTRNNYRDSLADKCISESQMNNCNERYLAHMENLIKY